MKRNPNKQSGFSLIELMVAVAILLLIMAVVFTQVAKLQKVARDEDIKREMFQNGREFMDQLSRDLHGLGSPNKRQFNGAVTDSDTRIAVGWVKVGPDEIMFEGDVHRNGTVSSVAYKYVSTLTGYNCPCIQRAEIDKAAALPLSQNTTSNYYVALENVLTPPTSTFLFYDSAGAQVSNTTSAINLTTNPSDIKKIRSVRVFVNVQAASTDLELKRRTASSLTQEIKLNNY